MMIHKLRALVKKVDRTHRGLGPMVITNILAAKAKKTVLNVAPAGNGLERSEKPGVLT